MTRKPRTRATGGGVGGHEPRDVLEARQQRAWELDAAGWSQREIATELQISQPGVSKLLHRTAAQAATEGGTTAESQLARLLAKCDHLYRESMRGYERSQQEHTRRRQRQTTDENGHPGPTVLEADVVQRDGDPRFLAQADRALARRASLLGLDRHARRARPRPADDEAAARDRLARSLARLAAGVGDVPGDTD